MLSASAIIARSKSYNYKPGPLVRLTAAVVLTLVLGQMGFNCVCEKAEASTNPAIYSNTPWYDTNGNYVNAHGLGIIKVGSTYYLVGERRHNTVDWSGLGDIESFFDGMSLYSSTDLQNWTYLGIACAPQAGTRITNQDIVERPKILYNAATNTYIMYMHSWNGNQVVAYATSSTVTGPYIYQGVLQFSDGTEFNVGDEGIYQDTNGAAYVASAGRIYPLNATYSAIATVASQYTALPANGGSQEAPAFFKSGSTYFALQSQKTWWHANDNYYATAPAMTGPWKNQGLFAPSGTMTFDSQTTFVLPVTGSTGTTNIYMGDKWCDGNWSYGTYVWQPLSLTTTKKGVTLTMSPYLAGWTIDVNTGQWSSVADAGVSYNDNAYGTGLDQFNYQGTWGHSPRSGCYNDDNSWSNTTNSVAIFPFTGTQVKLYGVKDPSHGIMGVTLCDANGTSLQNEMMVDEYTDAPAQGNFLLYVGPAMPIGTYELKVRVTGAKNYYSSNYYAVIDRVTVTN